MKAETATTVSVACSRCENTWEFTYSHCENVNVAKETAQHDLGECGWRWVGSVAHPDDDISLQLCCPECAP